MRYFISGHRDVTQKEFQRYYAKAITDAVFKEPNTVEFLVGDYYGVDEMAQAYVAKLKSTYPNIKMTVYHMFNTPRKNFYKFPTVGGFENDHTRDCAMTLNSDYDIAWVRSGKQTSGTAQNMLRRKIKTVIDANETEYSKAMIESYFSLIKN
jgi:hypothetical protein